MIILIIIINFVPFFKQAPPPLDIFERISGHQQKKHRHPLIFLRGFPDWQKQASPPLDIYIFEMISCFFKSIFRIWYFFDTKFFETDTFFDTINFWNRYRYFFRYQNFPKPIPISLKKIKKFRNREVSKPKCQTLSLTPYLYIVVGWGGRGVGGCPYWNFCGFPMDTFFYSSIS